jgi:hypothetical protein
MFEYMAQMKSRPASWIDVFDFLRFSKTKGLLRDMAMAAAKQERG